MKRKQKISNGLRVHFGQDSEGVFVALIENAEVITIVRGELRSDILELFKKALNKAGFKKEDIKEVAVDNGPGGFSAVRARVSLATALSTSLGVGILATERLVSSEVAKLPSKGFSKTVVVIPLYDGEPNITKSKKKSYV